MKKLILCVASLLFVAACGSDSATAPSASGPPNVAGRYSGTGTYTFIKTGQALQCPVTTTVNQNGSNVTFAPLVFSGTCASLGSIPVGDDTITNTGSLGSSTQTIFVASCNGNYSVSASGGFFGNTLQFSYFYTAVSNSCISQTGNFSFTGNLTRS